MAQDTLARSLALKALNTATTGVPGPTGPTGRGIASTEVQSDYTLKVTYTDGTYYVSNSIRGQQGQ